MHENGGQVRVGLSNFPRNPMRGGEAVRSNHAMRFDTVVFVDVSADVTGQGLQTHSRARQVGAVIVPDPEGSPGA